MQKVKKKNPLVSVIMPAYNAEQYIEQAIKSVLIQNVWLELIIIIDYSQDNTKKIVEQYSEDERVIIIENDKNLGVAESRNIGIRIAKGIYIAFLDADDWWDKGKLEKQYHMMELENVVICFTGRELMNADGTSQGKLIRIPEKVTYKMLLKTNSISCSSVLIRRDVAREYEMCHDELHEDYILWLRILKKYKAAYGINEPLLKSRMSEGGKSRNKLKSARMQWGVYRLFGLSLLQSSYYMLCYTIEGIRKYY